MQFPVVGIGSSAGGLEVLKKLLAATPADSGIAYVAVPHLDPAHASLLVPLLAKCTVMPVAEVQDGTRIEPDHVYVIPPNRLLTVRGGGLYLTEPIEAQAAYVSIDWFLQSLAEDQHELAICIILSGTGSVREHVQRLGRLLRKHGDKQAILYEVVTRGTAEEFTSDRRRQHHAYR